MMNDCQKIADLPFDPMLLSLKTLERLAKTNEFLRGVYFARISNKAAGCPSENLV